MTPHRCFWVPDADPLYEAYHEVVPVRRATDDTVAFAEGRSDGTLRIRLMGQPFCMMRGPGGALALNL